MVVNKPPKLGKNESKLEDASSQSFMRSFKAYKEFIFTLLSQDCSYLIEIINFILNESLKLWTISASDKISLKIGSELTFDSIEEIQKKARTILQSSSTNEITLITDHRDEDFITELIKTHPNAKEKGIIGNDKIIKVYKGKSQQNTLCFFYSVSDNLWDVKPALTLEKNNPSIMDISYMKWINEVAVKLSHNMISAIKDLGTDIKLYLDLLVSIAEMFPFNKPKIQSIILKMIPHSALQVQIHSIYLRILFYIIEKMQYYEEEILEAVLTRFMQIDVHIKNKQLANKRHFTSQDLKADIYLYYLIQHFK